EFSAGGVIYRKTGEDFEVALIHVRNRWGLPKGHVEEGERVEEAALREVRDDVRDHDHEADDARWFPIEQAIKQLKFATERKMVHRALAMLTARQRQQRPPGAQGSS